jgi:hypothetical protein
MICALVNFLSLSEKNSLLTGKISFAFPDCCFVHLSLDKPAKGEESIMVKSADIDRTMSTYQEIAYYTGRRPQKPISPTLDPAFFNTENKYGATVNHSPAFSVVETTGYAWNDSLSGGMNQTQSMDGAFHKTAEWGDVGRR